MRIATVVLLVASVEQVDAKEKMVDDLLDRAPKASPLHRISLDDTMLGKSSHLAIHPGTSPRMNLRPSLQHCIRLHSTACYDASPWTKFQPRLIQERTSRHQIQARAASTVGDVEVERVQNANSKYLPFKNVKPKLIPKKPVELKNEVDSSFVFSNTELSQEELIELAKQFVNIFDIFGGAKNDSLAVRDLLADDFQFIAPVVGPLAKDVFLQAFSSFNLADAFPDGNPNYYNFHVDPFKPNRVFFMSKFIGTNTGRMAGLLPVTNKKVEAPPQANSVTFNPNGEISMFTTGYVMDKTIGNTGGLGAAYGIFYALGYGLPFPEAQPWQPSPLYGLANSGNLISGIVDSLRQSSNNQASSQSTIQTTLTDQDMGADPESEAPNRHLPFKGVNPKLVPKKRFEFNTETRLSVFPPKPELSEQELIELTKNYLNCFQADFGFGTKMQDPDAPTVRDFLADDFQFIAPVVGPLSKDAFLQAFSTFKLGDAFPDANPNYYNFHVDPFKPNRVFYSSHFMGTNTGSIAGVLPATNKRVESPPEANSVTFNSRGEITMFTIGYVMDKNIGTTGGLGGAYGMFYAIGYGLPFPEAQPWFPSLPYILATGGAALRDLRKN